MSAEPVRWVVRAFNAAGFNFATRYVLERPEVRMARAYFELIHGARVVVESYPV